MWGLGRLTEFIGGDGTEEQGAAQGTSEMPDIPMEGEVTLDDLKSQNREQQKLILQLKDMIREREKTVADKENELKELNAKFSKFKLQSKSKLAGLTKQLEEAQRHASDVLERASVGSDESTLSVSTISSEVSEAAGGADPQRIRAKVKLYKKKLDIAEKKLREKEEQIKDKQKEVEIKERVIGERDDVVKTLTAQLEEQIKLMENLQKSASDGESGGVSSAQHDTRKERKTNISAVTHGYINSQELPILAVYERKFKFNTSWMSLDGQSNKDLAKSH